MWFALPWRDTDLGGIRDAQLDDAIANPGRMLLSSVAPVGDAELVNLGTKLHVVFL